MPRVRVKRDPCDCLDCADDRRAIDPSLHSALARLEPPPKSLIILIDGALVAHASGSLSLELAQCAHLDSVAREGSSGVLAACVNETNPTLATQIFKGCNGNLQSLPERFKGLHAALFTNVEGADKLKTQLKFTSLQRYEQCSPQDWPQPQELARALTATLGLKSLEDYVASFVRGATLDDSEADMAVLWLQLPLQNQYNHSQEESMNMTEACAALSWTDSLIRRLDSLPGFKDTVLLSVVIVPPHQGPPLPLESLIQTPPELTVVGSKDENDDEVTRIRRPLQTFQFSGVEKVEIDEKRAAVVVHRLAGVIRRDRVQELDLKDIEVRGSGKCILAERMLPEIAYKIDKAPKYGA